MTEDELGERLRFLSAAQHEANTPLAVIRGWADTFASMWEDLAPADRERGATSIQRHAGQMIELLEALFVELRADAHARAPAGVTSQLAEVVPDAIGQIRDVELAGPVPTLTTGVDPRALEVLLGAAAVGLRIRGGGPVTVTVEEEADGASITMSPGGAPASDSSRGTSRSDPSQPDAFAPFPDGHPSPSGIRLYAARRLARAAGGQLTRSGDDRLRVWLPPA